jgi:nicotinamide-nucleotide amidase
MKACIIAVGSELLTPLRVDTNSLRITERLNEIGYEVRHKTIVGDDVDDLTEVLSAELLSADLVICTGGLGPTDDDITREAVSKVTTRPLEMHPEILERIRERFARRNLKMADINQRQAMVPHGAAVLENVNGTAPGLWLEHHGKPIVLLPGPPREMIPILEAVIRDRLAPQSGGLGLFRRVLRITGATESDVDARSQPVYSRWQQQDVPISTTILAVLGQIELHLTAIASDRATADRVLDFAVEQLEGTLGSIVYSVDGSPLEAVVGDLLRRTGWRVAAAESCTGGLLTSRLTDVPGSSDYVEASAICYSNRAKVDWLGVDGALIAEHGAVSDPVARAMAERVRVKAGVDVGIGVTGIAGPGGGTPGKPVGTVAVAVSTADVTESRTFQFIGGREQVKYQATQAALNMLRLLMLGL